MNALCRISRLWPIVTDASKVLLYKQQSSLKKITELQAYFCSKNFGLYGNEEEDSFGEFNRRGAYVDHRANAFEKPNRRNEDYEDYDEEDIIDKRRNRPGAYFANRNRNSEQARRSSVFADSEEGDDGFDDPPPRYGDERRSQFGFKGRNYGGFSDRRSGGYEGRSFGGYADRGFGGNRDRNFGFRDNRMSDRFGRSNDYGAMRVQDASKYIDASNLPPLKKNLYTEHPDITAMSEEEVAEHRESLSISVKGKMVPKPVLQFSHLRVPDSMFQLINEQNYEKPTAIQAQGWPIALSGEDMIGISQTGSGKTLAYALPAVIHILNQSKPEFSGFEYTPQALVLAPTRELAQQIHAVCNNFRHTCGIRSCCVYGGASKLVQRDRMKGTQICIATPGRLIDFLNERAVNLSHVSYLVLDEADRMLDMGFEPQIRQIIECTRSDRQTLMWSATWPREVQTLAQDFLTDFVQVTIGSEDLTANPNITQNIYVVDTYSKINKLITLLKGIKTQNDSKILIFAQTKRTVDFVTNKLNNLGVFAMSIHGDVSQTGRDRVLQNFRNKTSAVLVATDVAARGLDINDIDHIVNFDFPSNIEDYIHRIGRTARGNKTGNAYSFVTEENVGIVKSLISVIEQAGQTPSQELLDLQKSIAPKHGRNQFGRYQGRRY